jgi:putative transposase
VRQAYIHEGVYLPLAAVFHHIKDHEASSALPRTVSNDVLRQLDHDWRSFFAARAAWKVDPSTFVGQPRLPGYKGKH